MGTEASCSLGGRHLAWTRAPGECAASIAANLDPITRGHSAPSLSPSLCGQPPEQP